MDNEDTHCGEIDFLQFIFSQYGSHQKVLYLYNIIIDVGTLWWTDILLTSYCR